MRYLNQPVFPLLLAVFPIVSPYAYNQQHFLLGVALLPVAVSFLVAPLCIAVILWPFTQSAQSNSHDRSLLWPADPVHPAFRVVGARVIGRACLRCRTPLHLQKKISERIIWCLSKEGRCV